MDLAIVIFSVRSGTIATTALVQVPILPRPSMQHMAKLLVARRGCPGKQAYIATRILPVAGPPS